MNRLEALEAENQRLRNLLESSPRLGDRVLVAELLDVDLDPYSHRVVLNKGTFLSADGSKVSSWAPGGKSVKYSVAVHGDTVFFSNARVGSKEDADVTK